MRYEWWALEEALKDLLFAFGKAIGVVWMVKRYGVLAKWARDRDEDVIPRRGAEQ